MSNLLRAHGTVITMNPERAVIEDGAVAVEAGRIVAVGPTEAVRAAHPARETIDCRGKVVLPGLIDAHGHAGHSLIKTIAADIPSWWMPLMTRMYKHYMTDDNRCATPASSGARAACGAMRHA